MTIGIDASRSNEAEKRGTEWYAYHIIQHIKRIDHKNKYVLYSIDRLQGGLEHLPPNFSSRVLRSITDILWTQFRLSLEMLIKPPDILFVPAHTIPLIHPPKTVVTIHDLGFEHFPELYKKIPIGPKNILIRTLLEVGSRIVTLGKYGNSELDYQRWSVRFGVRHASHIISISEFTKQDIIQRYGVDPQRITVIPHGFDAGDYRPVGKDETPQDQDIQKLRPYMLFVGSVELKKNISGLLEAYRQYREKPESKLKLVIAGKPGYGYDEFVRQAQSYPADIRNDIHFAGWVPEKKAIELYRFANLFVFPSFFEGFGIPIIQAMACGVPVVCSNLTSLPEVAKNAAFLVDPRHHGDIAAAISKVAGNSRLRSSLIRKGLRRAKDFSWEQSAKMTLAVLQKNI